MGFLCVVKCGDYWGRRFASIWLRVLEASERGLERAAWLNVYYCHMRPRFFVALAFQAAAAYACSCIDITVDMAKSHAEVVFSGTITALRDSEKGSGFAPEFVRDSKKIVVFRVSRVWKGEVGQTFEMPALEETSACIGFWPSILTVGNDLLVYASRFSGRGPYFTTICNRTALSKDSKDFDQLGPGEEPKKLSVPQQKKSK
jgi:hypothetical protein